MLSGPDAELVLSFRSILVSVAGVKWMSDIDGWDAGIKGGLVGEDEEGGR